MQLTTRRIVPARRRILASPGVGQRYAGADDGGLGFGRVLICELSDQMTLAPRSDGGTDVRMRFSLLESGSGAAVGWL